MNPKKPTRAQADPADQWVKTRKTTGPVAQMTRMTFDLDTELHHAFTIAAAKRRQKLTVVLRAFVEQYVLDVEREGKKP